MSIISTAFSQNSRRVTLADPSTLNTMVGNPFAVLSLIAAPAVLTNASSVLALSTSNRFLRAAERIRAVSEKLERCRTPEEKQMLLKQVERIEKQAVLLLRALRGVYVSLGAFAGASLISIVGAALPATPLGRYEAVVVAVALVVGVIGAFGLISACLNLFHATRLSMTNISEEAALIRERESAA